MYIATGAHSQSIKATRQQLGRYRQHLAYALFNIVADFVQSH